MTIDSDKALLKVGIERLGGQVQYDYLLHLIQKTRIEERERILNIINKYENEEFSKKCNTDSLDEQDCAVCYSLHILWKLKQEVKQ